MFKPQASYFSVLSITNPKIARQFTRLNFVDSVEMTYPPSEDESLVMSAFYELLDNVKSLDGITVVSRMNSLHYTYNEDAEELDPCVIEKHSIMYNDEIVGTLAVCAEGHVFSTSHVLQ